MKITLKPALSTAVSIVGVLAAGAAAFTVNSNVLGGTSGAEILSATTTVSAPDTGTPGTDVQGSVTPASRTYSVTDAAGTEITDTTTTYQVGDAGLVVIDIASGSMQVVSIMPATGWAAEPARLSREGAVNVRFYSSARQLQFTARLSKGEVAATVTAGAAARPAIGQPGYNDDGYPGDDHGDDDHEDDEREDDSDNDRHATRDDQGHDDHEEDDD